MIAATTHRSVYHKQVWVRNPAAMAHATRAGEWFNGLGTRDEKRRRVIPYRQQSDQDFNDELVYYFNKDGQLTAEMQLERANRLQLLSLDRGKQLCQMFVSGSPVKMMDFSIMHYGTNLSMGADTQDSKADIEVEDVGRFQIHIKDGMVKHCRIEADGPDGKEPKYLELWREKNDTYTLGLDHLHGYADEYKDSPALIKNICDHLKTLKTDDDQQVMHCNTPKDGMSTSEFLVSLFVGFATPHLISKMQELYGRSFDGTFDVVGDFTHILAKMT